MNIECIHDVPFLQSYILITVLRCESPAPLLPLVTMCGELLHQAQARRCCTADLTHGLADIHAGLDLKPNRPQRRQDRAVLPPRTGLQPITRIPCAPSTIFTTRARYSAMQPTEAWGGAVGRGAGSTALSKAGARGGGATHRAKVGSVGCGERRKGSTCGWREQQRRTGCE
jgi:hypothetical protein